MSEISGRISPDSRIRSSPRCFFSCRIYPQTTMIMPNSAESRTGYQAASIRIPYKANTDTKITLLNPAQIHI